MPARVSETFILRTYPFQEADLIVSFFTRDQGKLRGVAKRARRPKSGYGAGLERLSLVHLSYYQRETRELVSLNSCELIRSPFDLLSSYEAAVALDYLAEVSDQLLPAGEMNERFFRLLGAVLDHMRAAKGTGAWTAVTYFSLWAVRLSGFLADMRLSVESRSLAEEMLQTPIGALSARDWTKETARDLRRLLVRQMESHLERKLLTAEALESL